jgi:hypothetical protein
VDRYANNTPYSSPYNYVLGNPIKYIDVFGDSIRWALDYRSMIVKGNVERLRNQSSIFNTLYNILDKQTSIYIISASDQQVKDAFKETTNWYAGAARGFTAGNKVFFSEKESNNEAFSEEFFHLYQKYIYGNSRTTNELDAEAKLFNAVVLTEIDSKFPSFAVIDKISYMINNMNYNLNSFSYLNGGLIYTLIDISQTKMQVIKNSKGYYTYCNYLKDFQLSHSQIIGDAYSGTQRMLIPKAYNQIINYLR